MDAKKKAEANLTKERTKSKKLTQEITSLKKQLPKNKKKKKSGTAQTEEQDDSAEIARLQGELDAAEEAVKRHTKDIDELEQRLQVLDGEMAKQASDLADKDNNLKAAVSELSELKGRIQSGAVALAAGPSTPNQEMAALEKENAALKKENASLKKQLQEAAKGGKVNGNQKDPCAGKRNADVNKAIEDFIKHCLSRKVIFLPTTQEEEEAVGMVWDALKEKEQLETFHQLTKEDFALYYGPEVRGVFNQKRSDLQANMKRAARGE